MLGVQFEQRRTRAPSIHPSAQIVRTKGVASRIALTLADSPFPAEASNIPSLAVWPCTAELLPLFRQPPPPPSGGGRRGPSPPLLVAFSASASAFVRTLSYPNSYPRKYGYVQPYGRTTKISRFTTSSCGSRGLRVVQPTDSFLRGNGVKRFARSLAPPPTATIRSSLSHFFSLSSLRSSL